MKINNVRLLLATLCVTLFWFSVCDAQTPEFREQRLVKFLALGTGSPTGTYFPLGNAFANVWSGRVDGLNVMAHSTSGSVENLRLLRRGELGLAIAQSDVVLSAFRGEGSFQNDPYKGLKVLLSLFPEIIQIVVPSDSDIESIEQLSGKRIVIGPQGSGNALTSVALLEACSIENYETINISYDEAIFALQRREADAAVIIAGIPTRAVLELKSRMNIRILEISGELAHKLTRELPFLSSVEIGANTYSDQGSALETLALTALLVTDERLSEEIAEIIVGTLFDEREYLTQIHQRAADISFKSFFDGTDSSCFHLGALKYYHSNIGVFMFFLDDTEKNM